MKVLIVNKFLYPKGGSETIALDMVELFSRKGHEVFVWGMKHFKNHYYPYSKYFIENIDYHQNLSLKEKINNTLKIFYSYEAKNKIERFINDIVKPDIVHLHNFAHQISPSILDVFEKYKIPMFMTLHDYKLVCPIYTMLSNGEVCEMCKNGRFFWCFLKRCKDNSYIKSLINTIEMYLHHKVLRIYNKINIFISPSKFLAEILKQMGFKRKIIVLPNFVLLDRFSPSYSWQENSICYFGRLSVEKGLFTLIEAIKGIEVKLKIIGEGPLENTLRSKVKNEKIENVEFLGYKSGDDLYNEIKKSMFVVLPSECYENNPRSILEAFALGKPAIGSRIGSIPELVVDDYTGLTFESGNYKDLREKILYLIKNPDKVIEFGKNARKFVEKNNNPDSYYQELIKIYRTVLDSKK